MRVDKGMQPNCSELVIRLNADGRNDALMQLRLLGLEEYVISNKYDFMPKETEWDGDDKDTKKIKVSDIPKTVMNALKKLDHHDHTESQKIKYEKIIRDFGLTPHNTTIELRRDGEELGSSGGDFWLSESPYDCEKGDLYVWYHQHCQTGGFPLLKEISEHFGSEVEGHDGGSSQTYEDWLNGTLEEEDDE